MDVAEALSFINERFKIKGLSTLTEDESCLIQYAWEGKANREIAELLYTTEKVIGNYFLALNKRLRQAFDDENIRKKNIRKKLLFYFRLHQEIDSVEEKTFYSPIKPKISEGKELYRRASKIVDNSVFASSKKDFLMTLEALNIYRNLGEKHIVATLINKSVPSQWGRDECIGTKSYRFGFLKPMARLIEWVVENETSSQTIPDAALAHLYNILGDVRWMLGENLNQALDFHKNAARFASMSSEVYSLVTASKFNEALCYVSLGDLLSAKKSITDGYKALDKLEDVTQRRRRNISLFCLETYIASLSHSPDIKERLEQAFALLTDPREVEILNTWQIQNLPIYLGMALQREGHYQKASEMYMQAKRLAIPSEYLQVEGRILVGDAFLWYHSISSKNIEKSISTLFQAQNLFTAIDAKGDVAETNFMLGILFREMGKIEKGNIYLTKSRNFYDSTNALLKVQEVSLAVEGSFRII